MSQSTVCSVSVSEIHRYPLKPEGVEEPLWMTPEWRRAVLDHFCESSWLCRASELPVRSHGTGSKGSMESSTQAVHRASERIYILRRASETSVIRYDRPLRGSRASRSLWRRKLIVEVIDLWREIRGWWLREAVDRLVVRVMLAGGAVVDLARYREDEWRLVGIVD